VTAKPDDRNRPESFDDKYNAYKRVIDKFLDDNLPSSDVDGQRMLCEAMRYSVTAGGKRLRGVLALAVCELLGGDGAVVLPLAGAIEYIHAYSLVHDDLPCMDDDDFRRGKPSSHRVYGEGCAVLAGDALLNLAFETLLDGAVAAPPGYRFTEAAAYIAGAAGARGMAGGQAVDLYADIADEARLDCLHMLKTGRLFCAAILAPAICLGAGAEAYNALDGYGRAIGLAFQIKDDLLDTGNAEAVCERQNYAAITGVGHAEEKLYGCCAKAIECLSGFSQKADFLRGIAGFILETK